VVIAVVGRIIGRDRLKPSNSRVVPSQKRCRSTLALPNPAASHRAEGDIVMLWMKGGFIDWPFVSCVAGSKTVLFRPFEKSQFNKEQSNPPVNTSHGNLGWKATLEQMFLWPRSVLKTTGCCFTSNTFTSPLSSAAARNVPSELG